MIYYCNKKDGRYTNFHSSKRMFTYSCVCLSDEEVFQVELKECGMINSNLVGYLELETNKIRFIFNNITQLGCCFPYGLETELKLERGRVIYLRVEKELSLGKASELGV